MRLRSSRCCSVAAALAAAPLEMIDQASGDRRAVAVAAQRAPLDGDQQVQRPRVPAPVEQLADALGTGSGGPAILALPTTAQARRAVSSECRRRPYALILLKTSIVCMQ